PPALGGTLLHGPGGPCLGGGQRLPGRGRQARARPDRRAGRGGHAAMSIDRLINVLVTILLIEMMAAVGLGVTLAELAAVARNWRLVARAALANYVCVPAVTVGLLLLFHPAGPMVPAGFLILAVCPGAPFGPPCTRIAKGNVPVAVGLMVLL